MSTTIALNPTKQLIQDVKLTEYEIFSLPNAELMFNKLIQLSSLLRERGVSGTLSINDHIIMMEWVNNGVLCNFSTWPEYGEAQFVAFSKGDEVYFKEFGSIEDFKDNYYDVLNEVRI